MSCSRVVFIILLLSMIAMQGIGGRGLEIWAKLEPEKVGKRREHQDSSSSADKWSVTSYDQAIKWKAMRRQARSVKHVTEATFDSSDDDVVEDGVVMDYAQPHRKPPIHNEKS